jgi:hypothetical protein
MARSWLWRVTIVCVGSVLAFEARASLPRPPHPLASALALPVAVAPSAPDLGVRDGTRAPEVGDEAAGPQAFLIHRSRKTREDKPGRVRPPLTLSAERARILLRSLTVPGWGQLTTGHPTAATVFGIAELGVWTSYTAFRIQNQMRRDAYIRTARVQAGIDLHGRDEEFQRIVGAYVSSDEYNLLVVARDAATLYYNNPSAYQQYYDEHSLKGADTWVWPDEQSFRRYRGLRKDSQRAALRANAALGVAVVNRLLSAIHAARLGTTPSPHSWELQTQPADGDPTAFRVGVVRRF